MVDENQQYPNPPAPSIAFLNTQFMLSTAEAQQVIDFFHRRTLGDQKKLWQVLQAIKWDIRDKKMENNLDAYTKKILNSVFEGNFLL